jgi:hypothetical protein
MEHADRLGLVAWLLVMKRLICSRACSWLAVTRAPSRLWARDCAAISAVRSASCFVCSATSWFPACAVCRLPTADWLEETSASISVRVVSRFCTTPAWTFSASWNAASEFFHRSCASAMSCDEADPA